jgi:hypothetical protein
LLVIILVLTLLLVGIDVEKDTLCISFLQLSLFLSVHYVGKILS